MVRRCGPERYISEGFRRIESLRLAGDVGAKSRRAIRPVAFEAPSGLPANVEQASGPSNLFEELFPLSAAIDHDELASRPGPQPFTQTAPQLTPARRFL
jgi:hypothetical protein